MMLMATKAADKQRKGFSYFSNFRKKGEELKNFEASLKRMGLPAEETEPYRKALSSEEALRAVFHWYRALNVPPIKPVVTPTLYERQEMFPRRRLKLMRIMLKHRIDSRSSKMRVILHFKWNLKR